MRCSSSLEIRWSRTGLVGLTLTLVLWAGAANATPALFDFGAGPVQDGFVAVDPASPMATSEGIQLALSATAPAGFDDRDRGPGGNGGGTESDMWRDFIFAAVDPSNNDGLLLDLSGLVPGSTYDVTIWSFDSFGAQVDSRLSQWNGVDYFFVPRGPLPMSLEDNNVSLQITADMTGAAQVLGDSFENSDPGVFINGMRVEIVPEPGTGLLFAVGLGWLCSRRRA